MTDADDKTLEQLVRQAGRRTPLPQSARVKFEDTFRAELAATRKTINHQQTVRYAGAAACIALVSFFAVFLTTQPEPVTVATVDRYTGATFWQDESTGGPLRSGNTVQTGDTVRTMEGSLALRPADAEIDIRLDRMTEVEFLDARTLRLNSGTVYVDARSRGTHQPLTILVDGLSVEHVGTQYQVQFIETGVSIAVREGEVTVASSKQKVQGKANETHGQLIQTTPGHDLEIVSIATHGERWDWVARIAPDVDTDGLLISDFLAWVSRETGLSVVYQTETISGLVKTQRILGPVPTGDVIRALQIAMDTTAFETRIEDGKIIVADGH